MPDLTLDQLLADWHLGTDSVATNAVKVLAEAGITPAAAAKMTPKDLAGVRGLGVTRLERVRAQLDRIHALTWRTEQRAKIEAQKTRPGYCPDCGGLRATEARNVVVDLGGTARAVTPPGSAQLDPCQLCDEAHRALVETRAAELVGA